MEGPSTPDRERKRMVRRLLDRQKRYERDSKDYEFSRASVLEHWQAGQRDMRQTYEHPDWLAKSSVDVGVTAYDLAELIEQRAARQG